jgi:hypothetical protein
VESFDDLDADEKILLLKVRELREHINHLVKVVGIPQEIVAMACQQELKLLSGEAESNVLH